MGAMLVADFLGDTIVTLHETTFRFDTYNPLTRAIRGKLAGAFVGYGTFQWTSAVVGLCLLLVRTKAFYVNPEKAVLSGERGSFACSLDDSISKSTGWLSDMLGETASGRPYSRSIILRSNSGLKRAGPVVIALNQRILPVTNISLRLNGLELSDPVAMNQLENRILEGYRQKMSLTKIKENGVMPHR